MRIILGCIVMAVLVTGCAAPSAPSHPAVDVQANNIFDVRQARQQLIGKTPQDVVQLLGSPDHQVGKDQWEWWTYNDKFHDAVTRKPIDKVTFVFQSGKVLDLNY